MIKNVIWTVIFGTVAAVLQSTLLSRLALYRAVPDIALGIIVYSAYVNGTMTGQLSGFLYGIALDFLSAAPLGLNAFVRTIIGALTGLMKETFFLDVFLLPMFLCAAATLIKALLLFLLSLLMAGVIPSYPLASPLLWTELAMNTFIAPFLFAFLKRFNSLLTRGGAI
ncbi:MAG: rod shape-determining protein MreD [Treponema sp.]|jgi:rod shape-determining protein MreD|nr:rod shape-determining protein MreD [Treponema sp.]